MGNQDATHDWVWMFEKSAVASLRLPTPPPRPHQQITAVQETNQIWELAVIGTDTFRGVIDVDARSCYSDIEEPPIH